MSCESVNTQLARKAIDLTSSFPACPRNVKRLTAHGAVGPSSLAKWLIALRPHHTLGHFTWPWSGLRWLLEMLSHLIDRSDSFDLAIGHNNDTCANFKGLLAIVSDIHECKANFALQLENLLSEAKA